MPEPPPGAGVPLVVTSGFVAVLVDGAAAGAGVAVAAVDGVIENHFFLAGVAVGAGDAAMAASFFFERFVLAGEAAALAAGDALAAAEAAGEASFLACLCFAGEAEAAGLGDGDWAIRPTAVKIVTATIKRVRVFMAGRVWSSAASLQC